MQEPEQSLRTLGGTVHCGPVKERNDVILYLLHRMIYIYYYLILKLVVVLHWKEEIRIASGKSILT